MAAVLYWLNYKPKLEILKSPFVLGIYDNTEQAFKAMKRDFRENFEGKQAVLKDETASSTEQVLTEARVYVAGKPAGTYQIKEL